MINLKDYTTQIGGVIIVVFATLYALGVIDQSTFLKLLSIFGGGTLLSVGSDNKKIKEQVKGLSLTIANTFGKTENKSEER